jgi:hypothetical protein
VCPVAAILQLTMPALATAGGVLLVILARAPARR